MAFLWPLVGLIAAGLFLKLMYDDGIPINVGIILSVTALSVIMGFMSLLAYILMWMVINVDFSFLEIVLFDKKRDQKED